MRKDIDIVLLRKRKKRRRQLTKFVILVVIAALGITAYVKIDDWYPALEGIGSQFQSVKSNKTEGTDDEFNIGISGGIEYQIKELSGYLAILSDAYLYIYDTDGELYEERQHAYANAMIQSANKKVLIYESGGNRFRVDSKRKNIYTKKLDNTIIFARISENGNTAVITNSENYVCRLIVFDETGEEIYNRNCVERVIDLEFNENGSGCVLATNNAENGELITNLISVSFDSEEDKWTSEPFNVLCLKTFYDANGIFLIGDKKCAYYNNDGKQEMVYEYPADLVDWDYGPDGAALLFENETKRQSYFITINSATKEKNEKMLNTSGSKAIGFLDKNVLVMNKDGINRYGFKGTEEKNICSESSYDDFIIIDDYIFLMGYDRIDRIEYHE